MTGTFEDAARKLEFATVLARVARYAQSEPGRERIVRLDISADHAEVRSRLSLTSETKRLLEADAGLPLEGVHPVSKAISRSGIEGTSLLPRELREIGTTLAAARVLRAYIAKRKDAAPALWAFVEPLVSDKVLEFNIDQAIDETGSVRASASRELQSIRRGIAERYAALRKRLESILKSASEQGFSQDEIITTREGRMVIPVKAEHKQRVHGFVHSASSSGATVFIEPTETLELNNEIRNLQFEEQREIDRILRDLTAQVGRVRDGLQSNLRILAEVDGLQARAKYSIEILGTEPEISPEGPIRLHRARHPLLLLHHGLDGTVPLDLALGEGATTLLISGPNAGGKSVAMKCVGLLTLMAQAGLHVPVDDSSSLRLVRTIYVEIGDEQSIESDLSTFSSHLTHLKEIANAADDRSLVLIDEIGSGTDPGEGGAIAAAVLESLTGRRALTIATTHQGSLKVFAHETGGMVNGAMEFDQHTLHPTYRFRAGVPGSSYALEMATRIGFPDDLMVRARELMGHRATRLETLLAELEHSVQTYRAEMESARREKARLDDLVKTYEGRIAALSSELRELKRNAVEEAKLIVERANAVIEKSVREIREQSAGRETVQAARAEIARVKEDLTREAGILQEERPVDETLGPGSAVRLLDGTDTGEVVSLGDNGKTAIVLFGSVRMRVRTEDLRAAPTGSRPRVPEPTPAFDLPERAPRELDLRGMTGDEALPLLDKFLDSALLAGLSRVDVIHGKGTGALRKKVTDYLAHHARVRSFRLGEWNEGGTGATVVELGDA
jgi:DNA mismatch repair protein MutS2